MRAGGNYAVQQDLTTEASTIVKQAVVLAKRRGHTQVTPLHVASTALSSPTGLLRVACLLSHSHPFQCKALELCFGVALNRLPATSSSPIITHHSQYPWISNALVVAFKRAQAHQRCRSVEFEQLIILILDDPSVSRVMREAGLSSTQVKSNVEKAVTLKLCYSQSSPPDITHKSQEQILNNKSNPITDPRKSVFTMSGSMGRGFDLKDAEKAWNILEHAIHEIYNYDARGLDFKEVYRAAYNMVLHGFEEKLYSGVVSAMTSHQKEIAKSIEAAQGAMFLEELNRSWEEYDMALGMIRFILIKFTHKTQIHDLGLNLWRDNIIHSSIIQTRLRDTLLELVQCERTGDVINRGLTRNITKMLMYLGPSVYEEIFEMPFLDVSSDFYRVESQQVIEHCDCGDYLKKAEERLNEEIERVSHYLNVRSEAKITRVLEKEMIETHMHRLVHMENSGLVSMIMDEKFEDLGRMYNLLSRVPSGLTIMKDVMTSHIREIGEDLVTDPERLKDPVNFVHELLDKKDRLRDTLLELVQCERIGGVINRGLMRNITKMLMDLGPSVYEEIFEKPFLDVSSDFYREESQQVIEHCDCGDYLKKAEERLDEEIKRVSLYLDVRSEAKITRVVEEEMIESHMHRLVHMENSGLVSMIMDEKFEDLGRMYNLLLRVPSGLTIMKDVMTSHIRETGRDLFTDPERLKDPINFVQELLDKKDGLDKIINLAFNDDKDFQNALSSSFEYFINLNPRSPEFISLFVDDKLRNGLKKDKEEEIELVLDKVTMLLRYLEEKDVFEKYYQQHLAKRLLSGKTSSDAERNFIMKLKTECAYQFTSKLEGM